MVPVNLFVGSGLDTLWERVKQRYPRLADFDVIRDQSQTHHTLVTGLGFGTVGIAFGVFTSGYANGWAAGVLGGLIGYAIREHLWLGRPNAVQWWDGLMDILVPWGRLATIAVCVVIFQLPWWVAVAMQVSQSIEALGYTFFRPAHSLFYGGTGDRYS